jgi:hypothetical protein
VLPQRRLALALVTVTVTAGLGGCEHPPRTPAAASLGAIEQVTVPLDPTAAGAVVSIALANSGDRPVPVTSLVPRVDPQISVEVYGLSDCRKGCVGTGLLDGPTEQRARASVDPALTAIPPGSADGRGLVSLVLALRWHGPPGGHEPCRYLRSLSLDGAVQRVEITAPNGGWLAAIVTTSGPADVPRC